jgi:VanZ family protein
VWLVILAGGFCIDFAGLDEYHQSFVAGRSPQKRDVLIDSCGVILGVIIARIIGWTGRMTIFRPLANKA